MDPLTPTYEKSVESEPQATDKSGWLAAGGLLGALAASSCCILPLALFSLGAGGAWIGNFTVLAPYQPVFATITLALLGYGHYVVWIRPKRACADGSLCATRGAGPLVKTVLILATILILAALAFPYAAPYLLDI